MPGQLGNKIPSLPTWLQKSNVRLARREAIMLHIDNTLQAYSQCPPILSQRTVETLAELYFALDFWLKECQRGSKQVTSGREPVVFELYKLVVERLCDATLHTPNTLPRWLMETFGKSMGTHGYKKDYEQRLATYLNEQEVKKYRLEFKDGLAYQQAWWRNSTTLEKVDTVTNQAAMAKGKNMFPAEAGHQGYVLSMSRDFYMMQHYTPEGIELEAGRFHSSYFAGEPVLCAGTLLVKAGRIVTVTTASGHYAPGVTHLYNAVATLVMLGVDTTELVGWVYGEPAGKKASVILESRVLDMEASARRFEDERTVGIAYMREAEKAAGLRAIARNKAAKEEEAYRAMVDEHFKDPKHNRHKCEICKTLISRGTFQAAWERHTAAPAGR